MVCFLMQLSVWFRKAHATPLLTPDDHGNSLRRKAHWPCGSVEGQPHANLAVLMGSQLPVGWHVQLRIIAIRAMTSQDGTVAEHSLAARQCGGWSRAGTKRPTGGLFHFSHVIRVQLVGQLRHTSRV